MLLLVTADLHYNNLRSRPLADDLIDRMNRAGGDVLLLVGDTASLDGHHLEQCLTRFSFNGPKLFVPGNHELWTTAPDSYPILHEQLPRRLADLGWIYLPDHPFQSGGLTIVGSLGWYDYSFAAAELGIPLRFYAHKISPGAAERLPSLASLFHPDDDIPPRARQIVARWNDGRFVHLAKTDPDFLDEILTLLRQQLDAVSTQHIVVATHHLPFRQLLPPSHSAQWDFSKAYLGSEKIGHLLLQYPQISHVFCGHSHFPVQLKIDHIQAINIGSGYGHKTFWRGPID